MCQHPVCGVGMYTTQGVVDTHVVAGRVLRSLPARGLDIRTPIECYSNSPRKSK